jgi:chromosome partitioning protein
MISCYFDFMLSFIHENMHLYFMHDAFHGMLVATCRVNPCRGEVMPTISFIQPKGGVGKSTAALLLATELAKATTVAVIDADPNAPIVNWQRRGGGTANLSVVSADPERSLFELIEALETQAAFVIVDTEGVADLRAAHAMAGSDLVLIPSQGSALDQDSAAKALKLIKDQERPLRRPIPHAILFVRVSPAIHSRGMKAAEQQLADHGVDVLETRLIEREAFKAIFSFNKTLDRLREAEVSGLAKARENVRAYTAEVVKRLKALQAGSPGQTGRVA